MKRKRSSYLGDGPMASSQDAVSQSISATTHSARHPVLRRLYAQVFTLRHYLLSRLPSSSKSRRRRLSQLGVAGPGHDAKSTDSVDVALARLLDSTVVGVPQIVPAASATADAKARDRDVEVFSQQLLEGGTGSTFKQGYFLQPEVVDFVIWLLFKRSPSQRPQHVLCHGFHRAGFQAQPGGNAKSSHHIPGLTSNAPNSYVSVLKGPLWCRLHAILGRGGDRIIVDLLLDCALFQPVEGGSENYIQISGLPLSDYKKDPVVKDTEKSLEKNQRSLSNREEKQAGAITLVRGRMLYARAALNAKGGVRFGMRHIHVLNRFSNLDDAAETVHIMRYIFPRQFGLHNPFTSKIDVRETAMTFKDYTLREKEISHAFDREIARSNLSEAQVTKRKSWLPKRLRGTAFALVTKMRKLNRKCSYVELLRHYCPVEGLPISTRPEWRRSALQPKAAPAGTATGNAAPEPQATEQTCFTDLASPCAHVSAFCRAVIANVIPHAFLGEDDSNKRIILYWVDQFICMRKFESLTLHQITQKIQTSNLAWLRLPGQDTTAKSSLSDSSKRQEIFLEFVYWLFDSYLVPLIRSNFYVTESNVHRNRLFYFRHDVWKMLTEPSLSQTKLSMFEEMPTERATKLLSYRPLGFSKIRLLPKGAGVRMITNLKRRQPVIRNGMMILGRSINSVMGSVFNIMTFEKTQQPERFGGSLFSVGEMLPKLASFRRSLAERGLEGARLYFAKVDVQSCFDNIPQRRLLSMVESLLSLEAYQTGRHVEVSPLGRLQRLDGQYVDPLPLKRYVPHTGGAKDARPFERIVQDQFVGTKANAVFVDTGAQRLETKDDLMRLLREHVERNLVKFGKKFYRQKTGIPQGSVLSNILCNFFYAEFEREELSFALDHDCLLLRLLDDFCLITTNREHAARFVRVMHCGNADYGVFVKASKSLTNFDVAAGDGVEIPRCVPDVDFPYCGVLINTKTLEVSKAGQRGARANVSDSLTVDLAKAPGQTFHRKALNPDCAGEPAFELPRSGGEMLRVYTEPVKKQAHTLSPANHCINNLHASVDHARLTLANITDDPWQPVETVESIIALAFVMLQRRSRARARRLEQDVRSVIPRSHVQWLACEAFEGVFQCKQTQHGVLLAWVRRALGAVRPASGAERRLLEGAASLARLRSGRGARGEVG